MRERPLVAGLATAYALLWGALAVAPLHRGEWLLEQLLPLAVVAFVVGSYRRLQLSDAAYLCVAAFLALHAVGAHHGYEATPAGAWLRDVLGTRRNPYDRVVHLAFGVLMAYPLRELLLWPMGRRRRWASSLALLTVLAAGAVYELLEWAAARLLAPGVGAAFVGAQGDAWDAQADMALAGVGALASLAVVELAHAARARWRTRAGGARPATPRPPWLPIGRRDDRRRLGERRHAA